MAYKRVKKLIKRAVKKVARVAKKRYFKGKGYSRPRIGQMIQDVKFLKSIVNAEKHRQVYVSTDFSNLVGQVNVNNSGHWALDVTPNLAQGVGSSQRIGASIKWHSSNWKLQFKQQPTAQSPMKINIQLIQVLGTAQSSVSTVIANMYDGNPFVTTATIYDTYAVRNQDQFKNFRILRSKTYTMRADNYNTQTNIMNVNFGHIFRNHHVKWDGDTSTIVAGQCILLIRADSGNCSAGTVSTLPSIAYTSQGTGAMFNFIQTHYYYDN